MRFVRYSSFFIECLPGGWRSYTEWTNNENRRTRYALDEMPVILGLLLSIILLVLAFVLARQPPSQPCTPSQISEERRTKRLENISKPGILQLTWLMGRSQQLVEDVKPFAFETDDPTTKELRTRGKDVSIQLSQYLGDATVTVESEKAVGHAEHDTLVSVLKPANNSQADLSEVSSRV